MYDIDETIRNLITDRMFDSPKELLLVFRSDTICGLF